MIYDTLASYTWLYVGSWGIGIGAFLIALTFKPFPKGQRAVPAFDTSPGLTPGN